MTANEDGTVTVCMDAVKGRCNRDPCRYFHPPLHLQAQIKAAQSRASAVCYAVLVRTLAIFYLSVCVCVRLDLGLLGPPQGASGLPRFLSRQLIAIYCVFSYYNP